MAGSGPEKPALVSSWPVFFLSAQSRSSTRSRRSPVTLIGLSCARPALGAPSTSRTATALKRRSARVVMAQLLSISPDAQREQPVHRPECPVSHAPVLGRGVFLPQLEVL